MKNREIKTGKVKHMIWIGLIFLGFTMGVAFSIWRIDIAKDNFWRCEPEKHGTGYCFYDNFGH